MAELFPLKSPLKTKLQDRLEDYLDILIDPRFDPYRAWIDKMRTQEKSWDEILKGGKPEKGLETWLEAMVEFAEWPSLASTASEREKLWRRIVAEKRKWEEDAALLDQVPIVVGREGSDREVTIQEDSRSSWQLYKAHLKGSGWKESSIASIQASSFKILRRLRFSTKQPDHAVKGMVVGHVQSGKTASMAGLIAMAADWGWNLIIVLTGTLENLRQQTEQRLIADLKRPGNLVFQQIPWPGPHSPHADRTTSCDFGSTSRSRYLVVSLKNGARLDNLLHWLKADTARLTQMRILIIDDEADQASIDTSPAEAVERAAINRRIVALTQVHAASVNYVAYTATPYANFLNEAYPESLYPQSFIVALPQSDEHFGPRQVFGVSGTDDEGGLGIVNPVSHQDLDEIKLLQGGDGGPKIPQALEEALCWFLCATATIRLRKSVLKPISMLVHTSARQLHHGNVAKAVAAFLKDPDSDEIVQRCRSVWAAQKAKLSLEVFRERLPHYGRLDEVTDYPSFDSIEPEIRTLVGKLTHIPMLDVQGASKPAYHSGIHLCIDNCANNGLNDEGEHVRLRYPEKSELDALSVPPAFIVVGGSTLSRGLTIENLVSTFFLRAGSQMDTLMQMGRWFGYRRGYELLPRIWMPEDTRKKFEYMAAVEAELREELQAFMDGGRDPAEYGPRVKVHPSVSWLRPTARNRMQGARDVAFDFSGVNRQTTIFHAGDGAKPTLEQNVVQAQHFLEALNPPEVTQDEGVIVWRGVSFDSVAAFLSGQVFHKRVGFFGELPSFIDWFEKNRALFAHWNVVAAGTTMDEHSKPTQRWEVGGGAIGKVQRSRVAAADAPGSLSIGALRDPQHLLADLEGTKPVLKSSRNSVVAKARHEAGLGRVPLLLVYRIDKGSKADPASKTRADLNVPEDLIGISVWIPDPAQDVAGAEGDGGRRRSYATHVQVRIPDELLSRRDDPTDEQATPG